MTALEAPDTTAIKWLVSWYLQSLLYTANVQWLDQPQLIKCQIGHFDFSYLLQSFLVKPLPQLPHLL